MMDAALDNFNSPNYTYPSFSAASQNYNISEEISSHNPYEHLKETNFMYTFMVVSSLIVLVVSIFGVVGNGVVIWLLGFRIKRNPFMTYILNLAVADLGVLLSFTTLFLHEWGNVLYLLNFRVYYMDLAGYSAALLACLNSSVNPFIYFLVGRQWKSRLKENMKVILQEVFKEEECCAEETPVETQL